MRKIHTIRRTTCPFPGVLFFFRDFFQSLVFVCTPLAPPHTNLFAVGLRRGALLALAGEPLALLTAVHDNPRHLALVLLDTTGREGKREHIKVLVNKRGEELPKKARWLWCVRMVERWKETCRVGRHTHTHIQHVQYTVAVYPGSLKTLTFEDAHV